MISANGQPNKRLRKSQQRKSFMTFKCFCWGCQSLSLLPWGSILFYSYIYIFNFCFAVINHIVKCPSDKWFFIFLTSRLTWKKRPVCPVKLMLQDIFPLLVSKEYDRKLAAVGISAVKLDLIWPNFHFTYQVNKVADKQSRAGDSVLSKLSFPAPLHWCSLTTTSMWYNWHVWWHQFQMTNKVWLKSPHTSSSTKLLVCIQSQHYRLGIFLSNDINTPCNKLLTRPARSPVDSWDRLQCNRDP